MSDLKTRGLKVVILSALLSEAIDDLRGSTLFKQSVKQQCNRLQKVIEPYVKQLDEVYDVNPELVTNVFREIELFLGKLGKMDLMDLVVLNQFFEHYQLNPAEWQDKFEMEMTRLDSCETSP